MEIMYEKIQTEKLMKRLSVWQKKIREGKEEKNGSEKGRKEKVCGRNPERY